LFVLSTSGSSTTVNLDPTGTGLRTVSAASSPGASTALAQWDGSGNLQVAGGTACGSYVSTRAAGCTVLADGKLYEWVAASGAANLSGCNVGSPGASPSPYSGLCSEPYITLTWPVTFPTGCLAPSVQDNNANLDPTNGSTGATAASGSWMVIGTPTTTTIQVQRTFSYSDAGTRSTITSYDGFPIAYCIGN
jgi:hypothetical protein